MFNKIKFTDLSVCLPVICIVICYIYLYGNYCDSCYDAAWIASRAHEFAHHNIVVDWIFTMGADLRFFGLTYAAIYGWLSLIFGSSYSYYLSLTTFFSLISILFWYIGLKRLFNAQVAFYTVLCLAVSIAFLKSSQYPRTESLTFFLCSLSFFSASYRQYLIAGIIGSIAFETHPIGLVSFVYLTGVLLNSDDRMYLKYWLHIGIGGLIGLGYFILLHYPFLGDYLAMFDQYKAGGNAFFTGSSNLFHIYFIDSRYYYKTFELVILIMTTIMAIMNKEAFKQTPARLALIWWILLIVFIMIIKGANPYYAIFLMPPLFLLLVSQILSFKKFKLILSLLIFYCLLQYIALIYLLDGFNRNEYKEKFDQTVQQISNENMFIGAGKYWFFLKSRPDTKFYVHFNINAPIENNKFVVIRSNIWDSNIRDTHALNTKLQHLACPMKQLAKFNYNKHIVQFEQYDCRGKSLEKIRD